MMSFVLATPVVSIILATRTRAYRGVAPVARDSAHCCLGKVQESAVCWRFLCLTLPGVSAAATVAVAGETVPRGGRVAPVVTACAEFIP